MEQLTPINFFLLESIRQLAHRMVVCLDDEILPLLPVLMEKLSSTSITLDSMNHLLIFTHQILAKHKKESLRSGVNFNIILATAARFSVVPEATEASRSQGKSHFLCIAIIWFQMKQVISYIYVVLFYN